jgi:hypothetical protein
MISSIGTEADREERRMDSRRVPNLEEMDAQQARSLLEKLAADLSPEEEYAIRHEDYVMEMPQSGERFVSRENVRAFQEAFRDNADKPTIRIRRVLVGAGLWVVESAVDYGDGRVLHGAAILELKDGKVSSSTGWTRAAPRENR